MTEKVLFINHELYQSDVHFPLSIAYLASSLEKADAEVQIYDQAIYHQTNKELAQFLNDTNWDIIGVSFLAARYAETVKPLLEVISKHKKDALLVVGGHGPAPISEFILNDTPTDVVCTGESEETIIELVTNNDFSKIKGIAYKENGDIIINEQRQPPDVNKLPFPAWHLFDMATYTTCLKFTSMKPSDKAFSVLTSRGCPHKCSFCFRLVKGLRLRSIKNVVEEMKLLNERYGVSYFNFNDEYFSLSKKRLYEFRGELERNNLNIRFETNARVDKVDEEKLKLLREIGCTFLNFGFESMDQKVLDLMNKKTTVEQNERAAEIAKKVGISAGLNFIWGCVGDTEESLQKNVDFIKRYTDYSQARTVRPVTPYPGSPLYYHAIKEGLLLGPDDFFRCFKNSDLITINFTGMDIREMYRALYKANYELIWDYHAHNPSELNEEEANELIDAFHDLYFLGKTDFRGSRHYEREEENATNSSM